jgi:tetratricopeptide (TPR) repeat protein
LFQSVGNPAEQKRLLSHVLKLRRERGDARGVAQKLRSLSDANQALKLHGEGTQQAKEALGIYEKIGGVVEQARCLIDLAFLLCPDKQFDAAEEAASQAIRILPEKGEEFLVGQSHRILGNVYRFKGEREKAIRHLEVALEIASTFHWNNQLFGVHYSLA